MKETRWIRLALCLLALLLCLSPTGFAAPLRAEETPDSRTEEPEEQEERREPEEPDDPEETVKTDEDWIEEYQIPDSWSRPALLFAVKTGLMNGRGDGTLSPEGRTTRAETATILVRVLGGTVKTDLSGFRDADPDAWYYEPLSKAVALGLLNGYGDGTISPNANITREQAFTVIARAFGVTGGTEEELYEFDDCEYVSPWARGSMAAMVHAGYVKGSGGRLNPGSNITRQELAQVLYNLLDGFGEDYPAEGMAGDYVLRGVDEALPVLQHRGNLIVCGEAPSLVLDEDDEISGRLVLQGVGPLTLEANARIGRLVLCRPTTLQGSVETISVTAPAALYGSYMTLDVYEDTVLYGTASHVSLHGGRLTLAEEGSIRELSACGGSAEIDGTVEQADVWAKGFRLEGSGTVQKLVVHKKNVSVDCTVVERTDEIDAGLDGLSGTLVGGNAPTVEQPRLLAQVQLSGVDESFMSQPRRCRLLWYVDGEFAAREDGYLLRDGVIAEHELNFSRQLLRATSEPSEFTLYVYYEDEVFSVSFEVDVSEGIRYAAEHVRTQNVQAWLRYDAGMSRSIGGGTFRTVSADTQVVLLCTSEGQYAKIRLSDGTVGWVSYNALKYSNMNYYTTQKYSTETKEYYVNHVANYRSGNQYLIWVSLWTQEVNVFQGSKGNWKLIRTMACGTGLNTSPTPVESVRILYKSWQWNYESFYVHHISVFDSARGFHSVPVNYEDGSIYYGVLGRPVSHGCIRLSIEDAVWVWNSMPVGTQVEIY